MFFQLIAEILGIFVLADVLCRLTMHQGLWKSVKGLFPQQVEDAVTSITEPLPNEREEADRVAQLRRELERAKEEVRVAEEAGAVTDELAEKRRLLKNARAKLARAQGQVNKDADDLGTFRV